MSVFETPIVLDKVRAEQNLSSTTIYSKSTISNFTSRPSTLAFMEFKKKMASQLMDLNNSMSNLIRESVSGIDAICNKVRNCLIDMEHREKKMFLENDSCSIVHEEIIEYEMEEIVIEKQKPTEHIPKFRTEIQTTNAGDSKLAFVPLEMPKRFKKIEERNGILSKLEECINNSEAFDSIMDEFVENINNRIYALSAMKTKKINESGDKKSDSKLPESEKTDPKLPETDPKPLKSTESFTNNIEVNCSDDIDEPSLKVSSKTGLIPLIPDVYRKRGTPNLNKKMQLQIEANDSFIGFQRLMQRRKYYDENSNKKSQDEVKKIKRPQIVKVNRKKSVKVLTTNKKSLEQSKASKIKELAKKYTDSLWFSHPLKLASITKRKERIQRCTLTSFSQVFTDKNGKNFKATKSEKFNVKKNDMFVSNKKDLPPSQSTTCNCSLTVHNIGPVSSATRCQQQWIRAKLRQCTRKLQVSDILDDLTNQDLLPIQSEYPRKDNYGTTNLNLMSNVQDSYLYKLIYGDKQETAWNNLVKMKSKVSLTKKHNKKLTNRNKCRGGNKNQEINEENKANIIVEEDESSKKEGNKENINKDSVKNKTNKKNSAKSTKKAQLRPKPRQKAEIIRTLLPHMTDVNGHLNQTLIVMPVRVIPDFLIRNNSRVGDQSSHSLLSAIPPKLPLTPVKETGTHSRKADWHASTKPHEPKMEIKPPSQIISKVSYIPKTSSIIPSSKNSDPKSKFDSNSKKSNHELLNVKAKINRQMSNMERKLWANKYGKSTAQKLCNYLSKQSPIKPEVKEEKKRTIKKPTTRSLDRESKKVFVSKVKTDENSKKINNNTVLDNQMKQPSVTSRQEVMLHHLKNLKQRNDVIEKNIQKAIDVIEAKMIDILSAPPDTSSTEAFDAMEREITNVLTMMKKENEDAPHKRLMPKSNREATKRAIKKRKDIIKNQTDKLNEEVQSLTDDLFKKLENILGSSSSSPRDRTSSDTVQLKCVKGRKTENKRPPVHISSTTSSEERFCIINSVSPAIKSAKPEVKPNVAAQVQPPAESKQSTAKPEMNEEATQSEPEPNLILRSENQKTITSNEPIKEETPKEIKNKTTPKSKFTKTILPDEVETAQRIVENGENNKLSQEGINSSNLYSKIVECDEITTNSSDKSKEENSIHKNVIFEELISETFLTYSVQHTNTEIVPCSLNNLSSEETPPASEFHIEMDQSWSKELRNIVNAVEEVYNEINSDGEENEIDQSITAEFYTPKRNPEILNEEKLENIETTPSCYNILRFLNTLTDCKDDVPEVYTTKMCYYVREIHYVSVDPTISISRLIQYLCSAEFKNESSTHIDKPLKKKVSFRLETYEKSNQVDFDTIDNIQLKSSSLIEICEKKNTTNLTKQESKLPKGTYNLGTIEMVKKYLDRANTLPAKYSPCLLKLLNEILKNPPDNLLQLQQSEVEVVKNKQPNKIKTEVNVQREQRVVFEKQVIIRSERMTFLKYFYAFIFILMFAAFNINIKCTF